MRHAIGQLSGILLLGISILFSACEKDTVCEQGSSTVVTKTLSLDAFEYIDMKIAGQVNIIQGATQNVEVTGPSNVVDKISTTVLSRGWDIKFVDGCYDYDNLTITITLPKIVFANASGAGNITIQDFINQDDLGLRVDGSGNINLNKFGGATTLELMINGSGNINANANFPNINTVSASISGSGNIDVYSILATIGDVSITGSGNCQIYASGSLSATISGSGSISYKGMPTITSNITGSGSLIDAN